MQAFKDYLLKKTQVAPDQGAMPHTPDDPERKAWKPTKDEVIEHWGALKPDQKVQVTPIPVEHEGSTYLSDTVRLTGTRPFIDSVLSRLKDLLEYESEEDRLRVVYRETHDRDTGQPTGFYSCYVQIWKR